MINKVDKTLLYIFIILIFSGLIFIYSASYYLAMKFGNSYHFFIRQLIWCFFSIILLLFFSRFDYNKLKHYVKYIVLINIALLLIVFIPGIGTYRSGARRWIDLKIFLLNPSEFAKLTVIIYLSYILTKKQAKINDFIFGILPPLILVTIIFFIILAQSGFSTASILLLISMIMFFICGANLLHLVSIAIISAPVIITFISTASYRMSRILSFIDPWSDPLGKGYHIIQSFKAINEGGLFGKGLGNSFYKHGRLPTPQNDFIFAVITEETGLIGASLILILYTVIFIKGILISQKCNDKFGKYLAFGITSLITIHAYFNIGVVIGILPPTGVNLPFISYGGSSIIVLSIAAGILLNISSQIQTISYVNENT